MPEGNVRAGFVGCGVHARETLLPAVQRAEMDLAAICDLDKRLAQRTTRRFGAFRSYQDVRTMLAEMDLDAVLVCGPPELHAEAAAIALDGGCHVWMEAPAAPTAEETLRLAELAAARGLIAQVGFAMRFAPVYRRLQEIASEEQFGEVRAIEVALWLPKMHGHDDPVLFDLPHALDLVRTLGGDVAELSVTRASDTQPLLVGLKLQSGAIASISFAAPVACPREQVTVAGTSTVAVADDRRTITVKRCGCEEISLWGAGSCRAGAGASPERLEGYLPEIEHFAAAVAGDAQPLATLQDAAAAQRLAELIATGDGGVISVG
ncbi:MAG: Gfo/Idh/MocA family oxidoreductase [candidate division WS1 bacterium]|nr:Gfo/Idh/MocA family oxidoreductase [candidate division WS1 bacterium]